MIKIGCAGTSGMGYPDGLKQCHELGLDAMELAFTHSIHMDNKTAKEVGDIAKKYKISLSIHCPYYINLASVEKKKISASKKRIFAVLCCSI